MEQMITFNGVNILLTTGQTEREVQNMWEEADIVISVYPHQCKVLKVARTGWSQ